MDKTTTFVLDTRTCNIIATLANNIGVSQTEIISRAVQCYAKDELKKKRSLLNCASSIDAEGADQMLNDIYASRINIHDEDEKIPFGH